MASSKLIHCVTVGIVLSDERAKFRKPKATNNGSDHDNSDVKPNHRRGFAHGKR